MKTPWIDRDFWDFLRGAEPVSFPDHARIPTETIEFKSDVFSIHNPNQGPQPSPAHKWAFPVKDCLHLPRSQFRLPPYETQGWLAYQCGDCGLMVKQSPASKEWFSKAPGDDLWVKS